MTNYLKDLQIQGKLKRALAEGERWPHYYVPKEFHPELEAKKQHEKLKSELDNSTHEEQIELIRS